MPKFVFIGAGSFGFTRGLVRDLLTFPALRNSTIALVDTDKERLKYIKLAIEKIIAAGNYPAKIIATTKRKEVLKGADGVICTILSGGVNVWQHDILIPKKYGVDTNVGDTRGPSGIFRALRTIPEMLSIARDMEKLCPRAILLNYTNPMAMLCNALQKATSIKVTGLCHSVQGTSGMLARWAGVKYKDLDYICAGINHLAFFTKLEVKGKDLYPKLKKTVKTNKKVYLEEQVRNEIFLALDYFVTESSGHNSEYSWWFRKRPDLIKKFCKDGTGWNPGEYAFILKHYKAQAKNWKKDIKKWFKEDVKLERGPEYAAYILNAFMGEAPFEFNGNVQNNGSITNLPDDSCVEVPCLAHKNGLKVCHVGALPASVLPWVSLSSLIENMTVDACLTGNADLVYQAIAFDPLTASVLGLQEIRKMVKEMFTKNKKYLPHFKKVNL